jgi:hypothetical protein
LSIRVSIELALKIFGFNLVDTSKGKGEGKDIPVTGRGGP